MNYKMLSVLNRVSIDVVEMVIVISDRYDLYEEMQKLLSRLTELKRKSRINDKLTKVIIEIYGIHYTLNDKCHREYDKPSFLGIDQDYYIYMYDYEDIPNKNHHCYCISDTGRHNIKYELLDPCVRQVYSIVNKWI